MEPGDVLGLAVVVLVIAGLAFAAGFVAAKRMIFRPYMSEVINSDGRRYWVTDRTQWWENTSLGAAKEEKGEPP